MAIRQREGKKLLCNTQKEAEEEVRNDDQGRVREEGAEPSFASTVMGDMTCTYTQTCAENQPREMIDGCEGPCSMGEEQTLSLTTRKNSHTLGSLKLTLTAGCSKKFIGTTGLCCK